MTEPELDVEGPAAPPRASLRAWARKESPACRDVIRRQATSLHLLADRATGLLARRAEAFGLPVSVWHVEGRTLLPAIAEALPAPVSLPASHREWRDSIIAGGAVPVVEGRVPET